MEQILDNQEMNRIHHGYNQETDQGKLNFDLHIERLTKLLSSDADCSAFRSKVVLRHWVGICTYTYLTLYENVLEIRNILDLLSCNTVDIFIWLRAIDNQGFPYGGYWFEVTHSMITNILAEIQSKKYSIRNL